MSAAEISVTRASPVRPGPPTLLVVRAVAGVTFREILRDRVLYNIGLCAVLLFGAGFLTARLSFIQPVRVLIDFGISALNLSCSAIAVFTGASVISREFERRTIHVALAHPVSRSQFILGKFAGIAGAIGLNWLLLSLAYFAVVALMATDPEQVLSSTWLAGVFLVLVQSILLASITVVFASFNPTSISVIFVIGVYLVGQNISQLRLLASKVNDGPGKWALEAIALLWPNLEYFNLGTKITYQLPISPAFFLAGVGYGLAGTAVSLALASLLVRFRDV